MKNGSSKVAKNTIALYVRMIVLTIISLFTYRIIFQTLGSTDYGTYNVVGGFVTMFSFISSIILTASQRYFALALANEDWKEVNKNFSINIVLYAIICGITILLAETIGLWFVMNKLNVDYSRSSEIMTVYQTSIAVFIIGMITSPFTALLIADENLSIYAWVSIVEGVLKVGVAYILVAFNGSKLSIYAYLLLFVQIIICGFYIIYCFVKYKELKFCFCKEIKEYKSILGYINWNMIGAIAAVGKNQGINIIINIFFGTIINAARAIAYQINSIISSFAQNFMKAVDPSIIKAYGIGDDNAFTSKIYTASKISFYLLLIIMVPFIANAEFVLTLWLGEIPEHTTIFTILALTDALILSITDPLLTAVQAIGKMKIYQITVGTISLINLPLSYLLLTIYNDPIIPFIVAIVLDLFITVARMINLKRLYRFSMKDYAVTIFVPAIIITIISTIVSICIIGNANSFIKLIINVMLTITVMSVMIYYIALNKTERKMLAGLIPFRKKTVL